ncbi:unnamed protein product [Victoria cruziana]
MVERNAIAVDHHRHHRRLIFSAPERLTFHQNQNQITSPPVLINHYSDLFCFPSNAAAWSILNPLRPHRHECPFLDSQSESFEQEDDNGEATRDRCRIFHRH